MKKNLTVDTPAALPRSASQGVPETARTSGASEFPFPVNINDEPALELATASLDSHEVNQMQANARRGAESTT